jgi:hypothetical protein
MKRAHLIAAGVAALVALACSTPGSSSSDTEDAEEAAAEYPVFEPAEFSGTGDGVVDIPEGATQAMATISHDGSQHFAVTALDANNELAGDLLVNTVGSYEGVTALGMWSLGEDAARLEVAADGAWTVTLAPLADAPALPESGTGDGVFLYEGAAATWHITNDGEAHFAVHAYTGNDFDMALMVNEVGVYEGDVPAKAGPALVTVTADGSWTIAAK